MGIYLRIDENKLTEMIMVEKFVLLDFEGT
jgi:hypothetical protein